MKIALVLSSAPGYSETFFINKIKGLLALGFDVELYTDHREIHFNLCPQKCLPKLNVFDAGKALLVTMFRNPVRVIKFIFLELSSGKGILTIIKNLYSCLHLLNSKGVDWVHFGFAALAVGRENIASCIGAKMAVSLRGYDISRFPLKHPGVYTHLWKKIDKVHTLSDALVKKASIYGMPSTIKVTKIPPAIDMAIFSQQNKNTSFSKPLKLLTVARLHWTKGLEYTIHALAILNQKGIPFTYSIVGEGRDLERLVLAAHQLGIREKIHFTGKVIHEQVVNYLIGTDIYLQYSIQEGFCNAALEAQAMGAFCIVSDAEGLPENVIDEVTGWVVPRRNPELLAEKIRFVQKLPFNELTKIRLAAMERVKRDFNIGLQMDAFKRFYNS